MNDQQAVPCMLIRGGTSKGAYFLASDMPENRDAFLLDVMGSPDARQIDGVGGGHPLTSKVAIVSKSTLAGCDIDFLFAQVGVSEPLVDTTPNCGNILAGVAPFAIERGLIEAVDGVTRVRVRTLNTRTLAELSVETPLRRVKYGGNAKIDGVPKPASPINVTFLDAEGSVCGSLLPTGNVVDVIDGVECTLIDNGMPVIVLKAVSVGRTGYEPRDVLDKDVELKARLENIRLKAGFLMNLGDVSKKVVPKIALVSPPQNGGHISTRSFIPHECHASIGVFAAVTVATAACMKGSPAHSVALVPTGASKLISVEHPTGEFSVTLEMEGERVLKAGLLRTARALFDGKIFSRGN
jgi:4-oxalomesaconate tautomerase